MIKKIVFSVAIVLISLFLCSAGCGNVADGGSPSTPSTSGNSGGSQQDNSADDGTLNTSLKTIDFSKNGFADDKYSENNMYIIIHLVGNSPEGNFIMTRRDLSGGTATFIPNSFQFQTKDGTNSEYYVNFTGWDRSEDMGIIKEASPGFTTATGFANSSGTKFEAKFYLSSHKVYVTKGSTSYTMRNCAIVQTGPTGWQGAQTAFLRNANISFNIPMTKFNNSIHQNKAAFTVTFDPIIGGDGKESGRYTYKTTFDGFAPKN